MRMGKGVEWALHSCLELASAAPSALTAAQLAELHDLPMAYLNKQLQQLARAGIVSSSPGRGGGFLLARAPEKITVLDVVEALEGGDGAFRCSEIRQQGVLAAPPDACRAPCEVAAVMYRADRAWRRELAATTVAELASMLERKYPEARLTLKQWLA